jgi:hypothetical protein
MREPVREPLKEEASPRELSGSSQRADLRLLLVKTRLDQCLQFFHRLVGVGAFAADVKL